MFVGHEVLLEISFALALERLVRLTEDGALISASEDAYGREPRDARQQVALACRDHRVAVTAKDAPGHFEQRRFVSDMVDELRRQAGGEVGDQLDVLAEHPLEQLEDAGDRYVEVDRRS
jgi:hypothetical protein